MVLGAILGALLQSKIHKAPLLLVVGLALIILPILSVTERWTKLRLPEAEDRVGGFGSGFLGGLTGHQGALRALFLRKRLPDKVAYAATASILALMVDLSRIPVYMIFEGKGVAAISCLFSPSFSYPNAELENRSFYQIAGS